MIGRVVWCVCLPPSVALCGAQSSRRSPAVRPRRPRLGRGGCRRRLGCHEQLAVTDRQTRAGAARAPRLFDAATPAVATTGHGHPPPHGQRQQPFPTFSSTGLCFVPPPPWFQMVPSLHRRRRGHCGHHRGAGRGGTPPMPRTARPPSTPTAGTLPATAMVGTATIATSTRTATVSSREATTAATDDMAATVALAGMVGHASLSGHDNHGSHGRAREKQPRQLRLRWLRRRPRLKGGAPPPVWMVRRLLCLGGRGAAAVDGGAWWKAGLKGCGGGRLGWRREGTS